MLFQDSVSGSLHRRVPKFPHDTIKQKCTEQLPKAQGDKFLVPFHPQESADGDFSDFLEEGSSSLPIPDGGVEQQEKHHFQSVFEREQFDQPAQNWKDSSAGAIPAGNTLPPGQDKGVSSAERSQVSVALSCSDTLPKQEQDLPSPALPLFAELCLRTPEGK